MGVPNHRKRHASLHKIISGGQTGVDRGALDAAIDLNIPHGGKCPRGRMAEDGPISAQYLLQETESTRYWVRTEQNVVDADATLIFYWKQLSGGTEFTRRMAIKHGKPHLLFDFTSPPELDVVVTWLRTNGVAILNCAGPRESSCPGIASLTKLQLTEILRTATWGSIATSR